MAGTNVKKQGATRTNSGTTKRTGNTTKKATGSGSKKNTTTRNRTKDSSDYTFMGTEVAMIVSFAISVLLFLSNFKLCGVAGDKCRGVMLGIFGGIGYIAPILLFVGTCFYMSNKGDRRALVKMGSVAIVLTSLCGLAQMMFGGGFIVDQPMMDYYGHSALSGSGGGLIGGVLVTVLCTAVGKVGAYLVLLVALVIGIVCITEKSLVGYVKNRSDKAYQYAKEDMDRRRILHGERKEEQRIIREEQKVRGVDLDATNLNDVPVMRGFAAGNPAGAMMPPPEMTNTDQMEEALADAMAGMRKPPNPADVFHGKIKAPVYTDDSTPTEAAVASPLEMPITDYVKRDTRTLEEMSMSSDDFERELAIDEDGFDSDEFVAGIADSDDAVDENGHYEIDPVEQEQSGINYDSFFIPEEPKTVVTASGKIIEIDTELVHKTLEKKKVEQKNQPENEVSVNELIEKKIEIEKVVKKEYKFPPMNLLKRGVASNNSFSEKEYKETAIKLQQTLQNFGVGVTVTDISCGPSVTRYELHPEQGVKVSKIVALTDDIKLNLAAADIRIEAPIPGKSAVGIEVPNKENNVVLLRDLLESEEFKKHSSKVAFAVGKDIAGQTVVTDIAKMPHLLIAGATGSGKSVCINTLIMSIIYKSNPDDVKLIMIDPKVVELSVYNGIPHLMIPVVTDPKKASGALNWAVNEMTDRYQKFAQYNVRDLKGYNQKVESIKDIEDENKPEKLPQIIIIVDELADLMMVAPGEVEDAICRLAQLARAAGIHLVIATQRPSVNVITGLIKANIPSRIAFSVSSGVDSRTIIDMNGAEKLLGKGDMLFYPSGVQKPQRVQGAFVSDQEVSKVVEFLTEQKLTSDYNPEVENKIANSIQNDSSSGGADRDAYFVQAGRFIIEKDKASIGMLQRMFKIGFNRAARIMDQLAENGVVGEEEGTKPRKVLMSMEQFENMLEE